MVTLDAGHSDRKGQRRPATTPGDAMPADAGGGEPADRQTRPTSRRPKGGPASTRPAATVRAAPAAVAAPSARDDRRAAGRPARRGRRPSQAARPPTPQALLDRLPAGPRASSGRRRCAFVSLRAGARAPVPPSRQPFRRSQRSARGSPRSARRCGRVRPVRRRHADGAGRHDQAAAGGRGRGPRRDGADALRQAG